MLPTNNPVLPLRLGWKRLCLFHLLFFASAAYAQEPTQYDKNMQRAAKEAGASASRCKGERSRGVIKTHVQFANCVNQGISIAYERAGYLYPDLTASLNAKRLDIAQRVDQKQITETQGKAEFKEYSMQISQEEITRNRERKAAPSGQ